MVTIDRPRVCSVLLLLTAIMLVHPPSARADRVDINDPTVLGPVLLRDRFLDANPLELSVAEVRYQGGIYSYVYAVSGSPYFPGTFCCEAGMVSFAVTGHPLEDTWGAINSSEDSFGHSTAWWYLLDTCRVSRPSSMVSVLFLNLTPARFAVVYVQSSLPPSVHGIFTYTGRVRDFDHDPEGIVRIESFQTDNVLVATPEPGTIGLFGLGLAGLAAKLRARRHRRVD